MKFVISNIEKKNKVGFNLFSLLFFLINLSFSDVPVAFAVVGFV